MRWVLTIAVWSLDSLEAKQIKVQLPVLALLERKKSVKHNNFVLVTNLFVGFGFSGRHVGNAKRGKMWLHFTCCSELGLGNCCMFLLSFPSRRCPICRTSSVESGSWSILVAFLEYVNVSSNIITKKCIAPGIFMPRFTEKCWSDGEGLMKSLSFFVSWPHVHLCRKAAVTAVSLPAESAALVPMANMGGIANETCFASWTYQ